MTANELEMMVREMENHYCRYIGSRCELENGICDLRDGLRKIGRKELAEMLDDLINEIDSVETSEIAKLGMWIRKEK